MNKLEDLKVKIAELEKEIKELKEASKNCSNYDVRIATSEEEVISFAKKGYDCQFIGNGKWLMRK